MEKFVDLCVVNKTWISLTTVTEKNPFTAKLAYEVKETDNSLTSCETLRAHRFRRLGLRTLCAGDGHK